jgi:uncharacterized protein YkwD
MIPSCIVSAMRRLLIGIALATTGVLAACDAGTSSGTVVATAGIDASDVFSDKPILDANGHPILIPNTDPGVEYFETELLRLVNDYRLSRGLSALTPSPRLGDAARAHARHMIQHRFISHFSPEGLEPTDRLDQASIAWDIAAENVGSAYSTPQSMFEAWLRSPTHRANIDSDRFTYAGVGYALDGEPTNAFPEVHYWAMIFLRR